MMITLILFVVNLYFISPQVINFNNNACKDLNGYLYKNINKNCYYNPDVTATTSEIIEQRGYKVETHFVTTSDGYILQLFRIPPKEYDFRKNRQPIFLLHGILSDSSAWVFAGNRSIGLTLAEVGYDVWIGNNRGTTYSRKHLFLEATEQNFWNYNMDILAANDIPAFLYKVADVTQKAGSIIYMGHSRALMLLFMYASENPEVIEQLLCGIVAFAPTPYFDPQGTMKLVFSVAQVLGNGLNKVGIGALFQDPQPLINLTQVLCPKFAQICRFVAGQIVGPTDLFLPDDMLNFFGHFPAPFSIGELIQHGQFYDSNEFKKFDYGPYGNLQFYGQNKPPKYNLANIRIPVFIYFGENDIFISEKNVNRIFRELGSRTKKVYKFPINDNNHKLGHVDFLFAANLRELYFNDVLDVIENNFQCI